MIEFWNVLVALVVGLVGGAALHSAWLHSKEREEFEPKPSTVWKKTVNNQRKRDYQRNS